MKLKYIYKNIIGLVLFFLVLKSNTVFANAQVAIFTPNGSPVIAYSIEEMSIPEINYIDATIKAQYPNAEFIDHSSQTYNCHGYAWHVSEGGESVWIGYDSSSHEDIYWLDGSYSEVSIQNGQKVSYVSDDHSAIIAPGENGWLISKWGRGPLMKHKPDDCPYKSTTLKYFERQNASPATSIPEPKNLRLINKN